MARLIGVNRPFAQGKWLQLKGAVLLTAASAGFLLPPGLDMSIMPPFRDAVISIERNGIGRVSALGLGNPDVIPLWFGETDLPTPPFIRDAAKQALDDERTFYTFSRGIPQLRTAIQSWTKRHYGVQLDEERISVPGSSMMCVNIALQLCLNAGDNAVIVSPIWPNIFNVVRQMGAEPRMVRLDPPGASPAWRLDLEKVYSACDQKTRAIFVCSPGNPTGWMISRPEQQALLEFARARDICIISDEVYGPLVYDRPHESFAAIANNDDPVFTINGFSKAWAMTGWRAGWLVHPKSVGNWVAELANIDNTGVATFVQWACLAALSAGPGDAFIHKMVARCRAGRDIVGEVVSRNQRLSWAKPDGAFYGFLSIDGVSDSLTFASNLVKRHGVGVAPGQAFGLGDPRNEAFIRICFAQDPKLLSRALDRIVAAIG
jgi:aspartate/methionine/tyrosine aminotransferase